MVKTEIEDCSVQSRPRESGAQEVLDSRLRGDDRFERFFEFRFSSFDPDS